MLSLGDKAEADGYPSHGVRTLMRVTYRKYTSQDLGAVLSTTDSWDVAAVSYLLGICHLVGKYLLSKCFRVRARSHGNKTLSLSFFICNLKSHPACFFRMA